MLKEKINNEYFDWMCALVGADGPTEHTSFRTLLAFLHDTEFRYSIPRDRNRAKDGEGLRYRFTDDNPDFAGLESYLDRPCSVLEMMIALALRCEETIMDDTRYGNRVTEWFWRMISSLGLNGMADIRFDRAQAEDIIDRFLDRDYDPDGRGGLFWIKNHDGNDLRTVEIWYQLCWYLDSIV